ncbi:hypothetical protein [Rodentibacter myodis]|uniref:Uncharacterized protein n=1 Tax=Rodentibacter myodis TaxID=1907939 RepID=A0A1V3JR76_9PAST|nr:hypothetical protein [Rodentibacter myodis]OOF59332.1 hypothetical protein BKL49_04460 [Rodentibacter myodis]
MNKFIIGFYGASNNGKTSALNQLIDCFSETFEMSDFSEANSIDRVVCLDYNGIKLGIAAGGDDGDTVSKNLEKLIQEKCDVIITACRTFGGTHDAINEYKDRYDIHYITCPYLYFPEGKPNTEQLKRVDVSNAVFVRTYIEQLISK